MGIYIYKCRDSQVKIEANSPVENKEKISLLLFLIYIETANVSTFHLSEMYPLED